MKYESEEINVRIPIKDLPLSWFTLACLACGSTTTVFTFPSLPETGNIVRKHCPTCKRFKPHKKEEVTLEQNPQ